MMHLRFSSVICVNPQDMSGGGWEYFFPLVFTASSLLGCSYCTLLMPVSDKMDSCTVLYISSATLGCHFEFQDAIFVFLDFFDVVLFGWLVYIAFLIFFAP